MITVLFPDIVVTCKILAPCVPTILSVKASPHWTRIQSALNADPLNAHSIYIDCVHTAK